MGTVTSLNPGIPEALREIADRLEKEPATSAVVLIAGEDFMRASPLGQTTLLDSLGLLTYGQAALIEANAG